MDDTTFQQKLQQYKDTVYRVAYTYLQNQSDAEDVAQDTFLKFYFLEESFSDAGREKAWLIRVTINACHNLRRSVWFRNRTELSETLPAPHAFHDEESELYEAVFSLPEKYRVVILLYYYEDYSIQEIAQLLQRKSSTIRTQLERARKKIKAQLEQQESGEYHEYQQAAIQKCHGTDSNV